VTAPPTSRRSQATVNSIASSNNLDTWWCAVQAAAGTVAPQWDGETWASLGRVSRACEAAVRLLERLGDETDASETNEVSGPSQRQGVNAAAAAAAGAGAGHDRYRSPFGDSAVGGGRRVMADSDEMHQGSSIEAAHAHAHGQLYADIEAGRGMPSSSSVEAGLGSARGLDSVDVEMLEEGAGPSR